MIITSNPHIPLRERIMSRLSIDPATGCWNYLGHRSKLGYGKIGSRGKKGQSVHRLMYELDKGPIGKFHLHHLCENPSCCNPNHLKPTTPKEHMTVLHPNNIAAMHKAKTHCIHGHLLEPPNLLPHLWKRGIRECRECSHARARKWWLANLEKKRAANRENARRRRMAKRAPKSGE